MSCSCRKSIASARAATIVTWRASSRVQLRMNYVTAGEFQEIGEGRAIGRA